MPRIRYLGAKKLPSGMNIKDCSIGVAGVGQVKYGDELEVDSVDRAHELLAKEDHVFEFADGEKKMKGGK